LRPHLRLLALAATVYVIAWFLPVYEGGTTLANGGVPGWEALKVALGPLGGIDAGDSVLVSFLAIASGFTNIVVLLGVPMLLARPPRNPRRLTVVLTVAAALNTFWISQFDSLTDLRAGYYLWVLSFALLAFTAWRSTGSSRSSQ
jgi:hypothetical protein